MLKMQLEDETLEAVRESPKNHQKLGTTGFTKMVCFIVIGTHERKERNSASSN